MVKRFNRYRIYYNNYYISGCKDNVLLSTTVFTIVSIIIIIVVNTIVKKGTINAIIHAYIHTEKIPIVFMEDN